MQALLLVSLCLLSFLSGTVVSEQCGRHEEFTSCPRCEDDNCPSSNDGKPVCSFTGPCRPAACRCSYSYLRAPNGTCVLTSDCPPFPCNGPNEEYNSCPLLCPTDDCNQATATGVCPYPGFLFQSPCSPKCRCIKGHWRVNGLCVPYRECVAHRNQARDVIATKSYL